MHEVAMLPTKGPSGLFRQTKNWKGEFTPKEPLQFTTNKTLIRNNHLMTEGKAATNSEQKFQFYHLYFLSREAIKAGDIFFDAKTQSLAYCNEITDSGTNLYTLLPEFHSMSFRGDIYKVVATTDPDLYNGGVVWSMKMPKAPAFIKMAVIPDTFGEAYARADQEGDPIKRVMLEMDKVRNTDVVVANESIAEIFATSATREGGDYMKAYNEKLEELGGGDRYKQVLRLRDDNTVIVHKIETKITADDISHLGWIRARLINMHGENEKADYMLKLLDIINKLHAKL